jgi:hypothetical protein
VVTSSQWECALLVPSERVAFEAAGQEVFHAHLHVVPRFLGDGGRVGKVMIDHRHEHEIGAVVSERKRLCGTLPVDHVSDRGLAASLSTIFSDGSLPIT